MKHTHWIVLAERYIDYEGGQDIVEVCHSEDEACKALQNRVDTDDRLFAEENDYKIYEDTPLCFDAGEDGFYDENHTAVSVIKIESDKEDET